MIVGSATETIVWSSAPRNSPSRIANRISIFVAVFEVERAEAVGGAVVRRHGHGFQGGSSLGRRTGPGGGWDAPR